MQDNATLQKRLLERLRHREQYQGARYELLAIATCVRAGFSVDYEDESDSTRKYPELLATHKTTGLQTAVEAKGRHRHGVLGFKSIKVMSTSAAAATSSGSPGELRFDLLHAVVVGHVDNFTM